MLRRESGILLPSGVVLLPQQPGRPLRRKTEAAPPTRAGDPLPITGVDQAHRALKGRRDAKTRDRDVTFFSRTAKGPLRRPRAWQNCLLDGFAPASHGPVRGRLESERASYTPLRLDTGSPTLVVCCGSAPQSPEHQMKPRGIPPPTAMPGFEGRLHGAGRDAPATAHFVVVLRGDVEFSPSFTGPLPAFDGDPTHANATLVL